VVGAARITTLVTDEAADRGELEALRGRGIHVVTAPRPQSATPSRGSLNE
jgi:hypothetical protein